MNRAYSIAAVACRGQWAKQTCESGLVSCWLTCCQRLMTTESVDYSPRHRRSVWRSTSQTAAAGRGSSQAVLHQQYNDNAKIHLTAVDACRNTTEQSCEPVTVATDWLSKVQRPTRHSLGHFKDDVLPVWWPNQQWQRPSRSKSK